MKEGWYDVAQVCLNGHVANKGVKKNPQHKQKFCIKCGASTITNCLNCIAEIQGQYYKDGVSNAVDFVFPAYCLNCGKPFPWTESKIKAAYKLAEELDNISENEKKDLIKCIDDIVKDTPDTTIAIIKFKRILSKTSKTVAESFKNILIDILSETIKRQLWPV